MNNYLNANGNFNPAQTVIVWIGANDLFGSLGNRANTAAQVSTAITNIQNSIWASVNTAISRGARTILIMSPALGGSYPRSTSNQAELTAATQQFNTQLQTSVNTFTGAPSGTRVIYLDGASAVTTLLTQTSAQGWVAGPCQVAPVAGTAYNCVSPTTYQWFTVD
jgi:phospholipase/lecithinase/hemolysin